MGCGLPTCQMQLLYMFLGPDRAFRMPAVLVCSLLGGQELAHSAAHGNAYESAPDCMFGDLCWKIFLRSSLMCRQGYSVCRAWVSFAHEYIRGVNFEQWPDRMRGGGAVHDSVCDPDASHAVCSTLQYAALKHRPLQDMHGASKSMVFIVLIWACTAAAMTAGCAQYPRIADVHASDVCTSSLAMESVAMLQRQLLASSRECSRNCVGVFCTLQQRQQQQQAPALLLLSMCVLHTYGLLNAGRSAELQLEFYMATASICTAWQLVLDS